jgi:hypothetical protein
MILRYRRFCGDVFGTYGIAAGGPSLVNRQLNRIEQLGQFATLSHEEQNEKKNKKWEIREPTTVVFRVRRTIVDKY